MVGDLLVFGFLVLPSVTALLLTHRVAMVFAVAVVIGALAPVAGLYLAFRLDLPSSPAIVGVAFLILVVVWLQAAVRGRKTGIS
jgi:manganese/iron transport system permease protein